LPEYETEAELVTAEELFAESEAPFYVAVTRLEHAEYLLAQDRVEEARPLLAEARDSFDELRAAPWLERVDSASAGARVPA